MIAKHNEVKRSKVVMAFWMEKGWMKYVSLKKGTYRDVQNYVMELFREREQIMDFITGKEVEIEEGQIDETPELKQKMTDLEEVYETIDLELHLLHERHGFNELYQKETRYRGIETFLYEDDVVFEGLFCKVEHLEFDFPNGEDYAIYFYIDKPLELIQLFDIADDILDFNTEVNDPAIEITLLSSSDIKELETRFQSPTTSIFKPISSYF